jgi:hypothetical protein
MEGLETDSFLSVGGLGFYQESVNWLEVAALSKSKEYV